MFDHGTVCFRAGRTSGEIIAAGAVQTQDGERCLPLPRYSASTCASNLCGNARSIAYFLCSVFLPKQDAAFRAVEREDIFNAHNLRPFGHQISPAIRPIGGERGIHALRPMENCQWAGCPQETFAWPAIPVFHRSHGFANFRHVFMRRM